MKICKKCGNLLSDTDLRCQKCGTTVEMYQNNQPMQQSAQTNQQAQQAQRPVPTVQPAMQQQVVAPAQQANKNSKESPLKKNYKVISVCIILLLAVATTWLAIDNVSLRKKIKLNTSSKVDSKYEIKDNTNNSDQVIINTDDSEFDFDIPEGTYPKVSQKYVHFVPDAYVATVLEQSGGISLLNLTTSGSGWIALNTATLEGYRNQKEALKETYERQGITVNNLTEKTISGKEAIVLELNNDGQAMLLIITSASEKECFILTVANTNNKTSYDYTTANELVAMLTQSKKIG